MAASAKDFQAFKDVVERDFRSFTRDLKSLSDSLKKLDDEVNELRGQVEKNVAEITELKEITVEKLGKLDKESAEAMTELLENHGVLWEKVQTVILDLDKLKSNRSEREDSEETPAPTVPPWLKPESKMSHLASVTEHFKKFRDKQKDDSETSNALSYILKQLENSKKSNAKDLKAPNPTAETFAGEFTLEPFTGSPSISFATWLKRFEYSLAFVQIPPTDPQKLARLLAHLQGAAKLAYEEYEAAVQQDYDQLTAALTDSFTNAAAKRTANSALTYCTQKAEESVHDFSTRLTELVRTAMEGEPSNTIKAVLAFQLKEKLRDDIKKKIRIHECTTYEEILKKALDRENYVNQKAQIEEKQKTEVNFTEKSGEANYVEKRGNQCFQCKKAGHYARDCPEGNRRQRAPEYQNHGYRNNYYRNNYHRDYEPPNYYRSKSPSHNSYRSKSPAYGSYRSKSPSQSFYRSKSPANNGYRNNYHNDRPYQQNQQNGYRSKSPGYNDYRNPRERYHSESEGEQRSGRNSSAESRKSPGPSSQRRIRFADTNVTEPEKDSEIEFFNFEGYYNDNIHQNFNHNDRKDTESPQVIYDLSEEDVDEENLVAFARYFGDNDDDLQYLHEPIENIPTETLFREESTGCKGQIFDDIYKDPYNENYGNQQSKVIIYDPEYVGKLIKNQKLKNRSRRLRWKAKKKQQNLTVIQHPRIKNPDKQLPIKEKQIQRAAIKFDKQRFKKRSST
uniref:CCHC-type domain-containing protein n=1 Tax=Panagrolaimus superbus TaxID=310955 RepID=A0A914XR46_9BILA